MMHTSFPSFWGHGIAGNLQVRFTVRIRQIINHVGFLAYHDHIDFNEKYDPFIRTGAYPCVRPLMLLCIRRAGEQAVFLSSIIAMCRCKKEHPRNKIGIRDDSLHVVLHDVSRALWNTPQPSHRTGDLNEVPDPGAPRHLFRPTHTLSIQENPPPSRRQPPPEKTAACFPSRGKGGNACPA